METAEVTRRVLPLLLLAFASSACASRPTGDPVPTTESGRVVVIGIPGVTWEDMLAADAPTLHRLLERGAKGNVSARVSNRIGEAYASLGAAERTQADLSSGWAFGRNEVIEHGTALSLFHRLNPRDLPQGEIVVVSYETLRRLNIGRGFNSQPGLLGERLAAGGRSTAVLGNADFSLKPLPSVLPRAAVMTSEDPPDPGIHREAVLAAMSRGGVDRGNVSRNLLEADPRGPFGIATSVESLSGEFRRVLAAGADLVVVETGDTYRADAYSLGLAEERREAIRRNGLRMADRQLRAIVDETRDERVLLVVLAATTPGGSGARGQLRPLVISGPGIGPGLLTSPSTRRRGILTISDLGATIAAYLGVADGSLGGGNVAEVEPGEGSLERLVERNGRAVAHDEVRAPISIAIIGLQLILYVICIYRILRGGLPPALSFLLIAALAFPLASYASVVEIWKLGSVGAGALVVGITFSIALAALAGFGGRAIAAAASILAFTTLFFFVDLALGAPAQLDSIFGYTSVATGRFFGLGNLGFALFAGAGLLLAGMIGDAKARAARWGAFVLVLAVTLWIGHPKLGADAGGTLTMVPAASTFAFGLFGWGRMRPRYFPLVALVAIALFLGFGVIDLSRPVVERTHLGNFLAQMTEDPGTLWLVARRKIGLAVSLAVSSRWGLALPGAAAVLIALHRRGRGRWREILASHPSLRAALDALIVAAIVGSLLNDSGLAIAGMMLAIAAPWALIVASSAEARG